ncbi:glycerol uptake operon antiterminator [Hypnocyclicus thermotrophus]|uniref:Glycerol uptake operon antiterminator n=1 Tax=Hypnocyclicus thermotrophus TaxID=1627895 RepID=A0AA46DWY8_9FUSO|nr:glycerol-3-phosphate responsive antiterminator [Hypnocyclicus thermotrophus]TDT67007.1 glycerol uptake operon antiterminator [Hypnocyclicus thermotrophus]
MNKNISDILEKNPIIAAINSEADLNAVLKSDINIVFILTSNILEISNVIKRLKEANKFVFVHIDRIEGLSSRSTLIIDYLIANTELNGIISTKHNMIKYAKNKDILAIQRFFILDSLSFKNSLKNVEDTKPDAIEILPGLMPKIIKKITKEIKIPVIAGGLIQDKQDIIGVIEAGAYGVSSTNKDIWNM